MLISAIERIDQRTEQGFKRIDNYNAVLAEKIETLSRESTRHGVEIERLLEMFASLSKAIAQIDVLFKDSVDIRGSVRRAHDRVDDAEKEIKELRKYVETNCKQLLDTSDNAFHRIEMVEKRVTNLETHEEVEKAKWDGFRYIIQNWGGIAGASGFALLIIAILLGVIKYNV